MSASPPEESRAGSDPRPALFVHRLGDGVRAHPVLTALGVVMAGVVALVLLWDWNWLRGPIERQVQARTGRSFDIGGDLDVDLGRITTVRVADLTLGNAAWSDRDEMASARLLEFSLDVPALFSGTVRVPRLRLVRPEAWLETGAEPGGNWTLGDGGGDGPELGAIRIDDGRLHYLDAANDTRVDVAVVSRQGDAGHAPVGIAGDGRWKGEPFEIQGHAESPLALRDSERPYRIDLRAHSGPTRAHARGALVNPFRFSDFELQFELAGNDLADLYRVFGIATPHTPAYTLDGTLGREGKRWDYTGFKGQVGDSDLAGDASVDPSGERPFLRADLRSRQLDVDDLAGFIGGSPPSGAGSAGDGPKVPSRSGRILPDAPYELDKLRAMDADVRLRAARLKAPGWPLQDMDAHLLLEDGVLRLDPLDFGVADGNIRSTIQMDAREDTIRTRADIHARGLTLSKLLPKVELARDAVGKVGGRVTLAGHGNSVAGMLATSNGDVAIGMGAGRISNLLMEFAGLDLGEIIKFKLTQDRQIPVRCAFGDFSVKDGVMHSRALAFDTSDTILVGSGTISLRDERLDLLVKPRPKDRSLLSLRSPLVVTGSFADPVIRPDFKRMGLRGAIALTLASIAPPAGLLATLELGPGENAACGGQYAK
ncbi:AsmA family protein [Lysobacter sp. A3-1-A15]|uniref:AsmA family protein n=1 Tax=Novilysobacter viscosus TaxID=3098602 RepID=UPI002EDBA33D